VLFTRQRGAGSAGSEQQTALVALDKQGAEFYFSLQNIAEFWNVCTRHVERNGYGLSIDETKERVEFIERTMTLLPDNKTPLPSSRMPTSLHALDTLRRR